MIGGTIGVIGTVPPGIPGGGGGVDSAEKLRIDCELVEYVISPLAEIHTTLFLFGSLARATCPVLATLYSNSPSTNLSFVTQSSPGLLTRSSTVVPCTPSVPCGVLTRKPACAGEPVTNRTVPCVACITTLPPEPFGS